MGANFRQPPNAGAEAVIVSKNITANGTYNASSDSADGYDPVTVAVPEKVIVSKNITANGTYNASSDSADGYDPVTVNVSASLTETSLWTNPAPTSNFALQTVNLSDSVANYDYIKVKYKTNTGTTTAYGYIIVPASQTSDQNYCGCLSIFNTGERFYDRPFKISGSTVSFYNCRNIYDYSTVNNVAIPVEVFGLK